METPEWISTEEASAALETARGSRARVAWSRYPAWYWLISGALLGAGCFAVLPPGWWGLSIAAPIGPLLIGVAYVASRARGVCEGWTRSALTFRDGVILYGPPILMLLANAEASKFVPWSSIVAAVLVFAMFAGTGLLRSAQAARS
jgi:hypothetical protein